MKIKFAEVRRSVSVLVATLALALLQAPIDLRAQSIGVKIQTTLSPPNVFVPTTYARDRFDFDTVDEFDTAGTFGLPVIGSKLYMAIDGYVYAYDASTALAHRISNVPASGSIYRSGAILLFNSPGTENPRFTAINAATGRTLWHRIGNVVAAGDGYAVAKTPAAGEKRIEWVDNGLALVRVRDGKTQWKYDRVGCPPRAPFAFTGGEYMLMNWAEACFSSANEPFLRTVRLRNGAADDTGDLTAINGVRGTSIFLTGDDRHYGDYGPGRIAIFDSRLHRIVFDVAVAPDEPKGIWNQFQTIAGPYAFGSDIAWVSVAVPQRTAAIYAYSLTSKSRAPSRLDPFGIWLDAASGHDTYFLHDGRLMSVTLLSPKTAVARAFSGAIIDSKAGELKILDDRLFLRDGDRIDVFQKSSRRLKRIVNARCAQLATVFSVGASTIAICVNVSDVTQPEPATRAYEIVRF